MKTETIIGHPDAHLLITVTHDAIPEILAGLGEGDHDDEFVFAVDRGEKYSRVFVLYVEDI